MTGHGRASARPTKDSDKPAATPMKAGEMEPAPSEAVRRHVGHGAHGWRPPIDVAYRLTKPQLASVAIASVVALAAALIFSACHANLSLGGHDFGGLVMPRV